MPLDPQTQAMIASVAGGKPVEQMTVQEMREALELRAQLTGGTPEPVAEVSAREIPGPGGPLPVRVYVPSSAEAGAPALVYFHGGGWVRGSLGTHDHVCRTWRTYQPDESQADDPRACPIRASSHAGLPPALIITAEFDPLRDEGRAYADRLRAAGTPVEYHEYPGVVHGFFSSAGVIDRGKEALQEAAAALREAFSRPTLAAGRAV